MQQTLIQNQTTLSGNIVLLCRFLRKKGFALSTTEESDALLALSVLPLHTEHYFREGLKAVFTIKLLSDPTFISASLNNNQQNVYQNHRTKRKHIRKK